MHESSVNRVGRHADLLQINSLDVGKVGVVWRCSHRAVNDGNHSRRVEVRAVAVVEHVVYKHLCPCLRVRLRAEEHSLLDAVRGSSVARTFIIVSERVKRESILAVQLQSLLEEAVSLLLAVFLIEPVAEHNHIVRLERMFVHNALQSAVRTLRVAYQFIDAQTSDVVVLTLAVHLVHAVKRGERLVIVRAVQIESKENVQQVAAVAVSGVELLQCVYGFVVFALLDVSVSHALVVRIVVWLEL